MIRDEKPTPREVIPEHPLIKRLLPYKMQMIYSIFKSEKSVVKQTSSFYALRFDFFFLTEYPKVPSFFPKEK